MRLRQFRIDRDPFMTYSKWTPCGHGGQMVYTSKTSKGMDMVCVDCARRFGLDYMYATEMKWRRD